MSAKMRISINETRKEVLKEYNELPEDFKKEIEDLFKTDSEIFPFSVEGYLGAVRATELCGASAYKFKKCEEFLLADGLYYIGLYCIGYCIDKIEQLGYVLDETGKPEINEILKTGKKYYNLSHESEPSDMKEKDNALGKEFDGYSTIFPRTKDGYLGALHAFDRYLRDISILGKENIDEILDILVLTNGYSLKKLEELGVRIEEMY